MEALVKLSFYAFTAATIALISASVCYIVQAVGQVRVRRAMLATSTGQTVTTHSAEFGPGSESIGRYGSMLGWFAVVFQGLSIVLRTWAAEAGPANMYEFSLAFIFAVALDLPAVRAHLRRPAARRHRDADRGRDGGVRLEPSGERAGGRYPHPGPPEQTAADHPRRGRDLRLRQLLGLVRRRGSVFDRHRRQISWLPSPELLDDIGYQGRSRSASR